MITLHTTPSGYNRFNSFLSVDEAGKEIAVKVEDGSQSELEQD